MEYNNKLYHLITRLCNNMTMIPYEKRIYVEKELLEYINHHQITERNTYLIKYFMIVTIALFIHIGGETIELDDMSLKLYPYSLHFPMEFIPEKISLSKTHILNIHILEIYAHELCNFLGIKRDEFIGIIIYMERLLCNKNIDNNISLMKYEYIIPMLFNIYKKIYGSDYYHRNREIGTALRFNLNMMQQIELYIISIIPLHISHIEYKKY